MKPNEFAALLNGREYRSEITDEESEMAKKLGYLVVFGYSDDLVEFRGVFEDEVSAYDGVEVTVTKEGIRRDWESFIEEEPTEAEGAKYFRDKELPSIEIDAAWCDDDGPPWKMSCNAKEDGFASFMILDGGDDYCQGLVIDLRTETWIGDDGSRRTVLGPGLVYEE